MHILLFISISNLSKNYLYPLVEYWVDVSTLKYVWISNLQVSNLDIILSKNYLYPLEEYWVDVSTLKYVWISNLQVSNL